MISASVNRFFYEFSTMTANWCSRCGFQLQQALG